MTQHPKRLFLAGLLAASLGSVAIAQNAPQATAAQPAAGEASGRARMDPAQRQQRMLQIQLSHPRIQHCHTRVLVNNKNIVIFH